MIEKLQSKIILSVNRALLGEIFPELVAVSCDIESEKKFKLNFFVDSKLSTLKAEDISCIETEVIADFPSSFEISHEIIISNHASLMTCDSFWIFLRKNDDHI